MSVLKDKFKVLLLEDNPADAKLIQIALQGACDPAFELEWVRDTPDALKRVSEDGLDIILTDLNLPSSVGLET